MKLITWTETDTGHHGTTAFGAAFHITPNPDASGPAWVLTSTLPGAEGHSACRNAIRGSLHSLKAFFAEPTARNYLVYVRNACPSPQEALQSLAILLGDYNTGMDSSVGYCQLLEDINAIVQAACAPREEEADDPHGECTQPHRGSDGELYGCDGRAL